MPLCAHCLCGYKVKGNVLNAQGDLRPVFGKRVIKREHISLREEPKNECEENKELSESI